MITNNIPSGENVTPVFGLTQAQLLPIIDNIVSSETVESFDVSIEHQVQGEYGRQAKKVIPTFTYRTQTGRTGKVTVFVKWYYRSGPAEAHHYTYLQRHQATIPRIYGVLTVNQREMLFLEYLQPIIDYDKLLNNLEQFQRFLSVIARFNAIDPIQEYANQLPFRDLGNELIDSASVLNSIWEHACKGKLGDVLEEFCCRSVDKLNHLKMLAKRLINVVNQMEIGLVHYDFYPVHTCWRRETGELLITDLEFVGFAPRFYDLGWWLGASDDILQRCRPRRELAQYYLQQYIHYGGCSISVEQFLEETHILWLAGILKRLKWRLGHALDGRVKGTENREEGRFVFRDQLLQDLNILLCNARQLTLPYKSLLPCKKQRTPSA